MDDFQPFVTDEGQRVMLRPLESSDLELLIDLFQKLSPETKRLRFHANVDHFDEALIRE